MRYFLDTEFNSFGGQLISIALVPEFGDREYYAVLPLPDEIHPWVVQHVIPYLGSVPPGMETEQLPPETVAREIADYLDSDPDPVIVADWPEDISHFCSLLVTAPAEVSLFGSMRFEFINSPGYSTAENSQVPHNALHDARSLRSFVMDSLV